MTRVIIGFVLGVVVTAAFFLLFGNEEAGKLSEARSGAVVLQGTSSSEAVEGMQPIETSEASIATEAAVAANADERSVASALERGRAETLDDAKSRVTGSRSTAALGAEYSPEIASVLEGSVPKKLQDRYESEDREESWATYMEAQFAKYFAGKPDLAQFRIPYIDCRTSICEVHAIGYGPDAYAVWNSAISDITHQPWHDFNQLSGSAKDVQPDVLGIVLIMARNEE